MDKQLDAKGGGCEKGELESLTLESSTLNTTQYTTTEEEEEEEEEASSATK